MVSTNTVVLLRWLGAIALGWNGQRTDFRLQSLLERLFRHTSFHGHFLQLGLELVTSVYKTKAGHVT